jgi:hypothetical protein
MKPTSFATSSAQLHAALTSSPAYTKIALSCPSEPFATLDYNVTFDSQHMQVHNIDTVILVLWHVDLANPAIPAVWLVNAIGDPTTAELFSFAHASMFSPVLSMLEAALSIGWLTNFPGLIQALVKRCNNQRSTQPPPNVIAPGG